MSRTTRLVLIVVAIVLLGIGIGTRALAPSRGSVSRAAAPAGPVSQAGGVPDTVIYGHVKSMTRRNGRYELRFDPALWLEGLTAYRVAVEDKQIRPGEAVANDYYIRDESHRLLTYLVPATARLRVITELCCHLTRVTPSQLARIVSGKDQKLGRYRFFGFWLRAHIDTVRSLDQQYQP